MRPPEDVLNHLLRQNAWATAALRAYAGRRFSIEIPPIMECVFEIDALGEVAASHAMPEARIRLSPAGAMRAALTPKGAAETAELQGDMALAAAIGRVLRDLRWDAEEDLSRLLGNMPAHALVTSIRTLGHQWVKNAENLGATLAEYWLEEQPTIAKRLHLTQFSEAVDQLRDDAARLEKRLQRLERSNRAGLALSHTDA